MTTLLNILARRRRRPGRLGCVGAAAVLAILALAQSAGAAGWSVQPTPNPTGWPEAFLNGVSCPSGNACMAVGNPFFGGATPAFDGMDEHWNGTSWQITFGQRLPANANNRFRAVSCPSSSTCEAVGDYVNSSGRALPLAEVWTGTGWTVQPTKVPSGAVAADLFGISCVSATDCEAVGSWANGSSLQPLIEAWDGLDWTVQPAPSPSGATLTGLNGVSCTSATACVAVGSAEFGTTTNTFAERWNGSSWFFETPPNKSSSNILKAVSCTSATTCVAVGSYIDPISHSPKTLGELSTGLAKWTLETTPNLSATFNDLNGVSCASTISCQAVGEWTDFRGNQLTLTTLWDGSNWSYESSPNPSPGRFPVLSAVSCSATTACTAVGEYGSASGPSVLTLAERFTGGGSPHALSLTRNGGVLALLHKPRRLELLVIGLGPRGRLQGAVALGRHPAGKSRIGWNLRVDGRRLRSGRYTAELVAAFGPSATSGGPSVAFELTRAGRVRVLSATCAITAAVEGRC